MKRRLRFALIFLLCIAMMLSGTSCASSQNIGGSPPPQGYVSIDFYSYEEWIDYEVGLERYVKEEMEINRKSYLQSIQGDDPDEIAKKMEAYDREMAEYGLFDEYEKEELKKLYKMKETHGHIIPYLEDAPMPTNSRISWLNSEAFRLPITWFRSETGMSIKITYLDDDLLTKSEISGRSMVRKLNKKYNYNWPTNTFLCDRDKFDKIYEKTIQLHDRSVKALVYDETDDDLSYVFVYDNLLVNIEGDTQSITNEQLSGLSFRQVELDSVTGEIKVK